MPRKRATNGSGLQPRQRKDGRWEARFKTGFDPGTGKPVYKTVYGNTSDECARKLRAAVAAVDDHTYILNSPSYLNRSTDGHSTHRHYDGRYYVCWSTPVRSQSDMVNIARQWADCTQKYIEYGTRF